MPNMKNAYAMPAVAIFSCISCLAQSTSPVPAFDVASIRSAAGGIRPEILTSPGSLIARNQSLQFLIQWAYDTPPFQITGPDWLNDNRFDVIAKAEGAGDDAKLRLMLQKLLADRFGVKTHSEQKEMQTYALTLAKTGPKFQQSPDDGPPDFVEGGNRGTLVAHRVTMSDLAAKISEPLRRPVIDETGLKGRYEIRIDVTAYMQGTTGPGSGAGEGGGQIDVMSVLFTALQQQLGVKLDSKKQNVDILVIDRAEKEPTEN
jgi:uncharacterized protein (TIGR03435 family)